MPALSLAVLLLLLCPSRASTEAVPFHVIQNIMQGNDIRFVPVDEHIHLDPETFKRDYASQGRPVVVRGAASGWPAIGLWSLASLSNRFGAQVRNREPDEGEAIFDVNGRLVERFSSDKSSKIEEDEVQHVSWLVRNQTISLDLQNEYEIPAFLAPFQRKGVFVSERNSSEYIFAGLAPGQGRELHIDYSVWSAQITGVKRWRLLSPDHPRNIMRIEGNVHERGDTGEAFETVLYPGDVIVWYAGWMHATYALEHPTLALSVEFRDPVPLAYTARYASIFRSHSRVSGSYTSCLAGWGIAEAHGHEHVDRHGEL